MSLPVSPVPPPSAYWRGRLELRADLRSSVAIVLALASAGFPAGLLWWWLAPRMDFRITEDGPVPLGPSSPELLIADDVVLALVLAAVGLVAGASAWFLRRRRGVGTVVALAIGGLLSGVAAWQVGELLGFGPTEAELADVGATVTSSLTLGSPPVLAVAPFAALLVYVAAVLHSTDDGLGRTQPATGVDGDPAPTEAWAPAEVAARLS